MTKRPPREGQPNIHICVATGQEFVARAKHRGKKRYTLLGKPCKDEKVAIKRLAAAMAIAKYKRGDVLLCAEYYDPIIIFEMVRK